MIILMFAVWNFSLARWKKTTQQLLSAMRHQNKNNRLTVKDNTNKFSKLYSLNKYEQSSTGHCNVYDLIYCHFYEIYFTQRLAISFHGNHAIQLDNVFVHNGLDCEGALSSLCHVLFRIRHKYKGNHVSLSCSGAPQYCLSCYKRQHLHECMCLCLFASMC